jgi:hypothetical protein
MSKTSFSTGNRFPFHPKMTYFHKRKLILEEKKLSAIV